MNFIYMETIRSSGNVIHLHIVHSDAPGHQTPEISVKTWRRALAKHSSIDLFRMQPPYIYPRGHV